MRAAQVPRLRRVDLGAHDDDDRQQGRDDQPAFFRRRVHPAEVPHAMLAGRRHVLQVPPHELVGGERAFLGLLRGGIGVAKRNGLVGGRDNPFVADGGAADVTREILDGEPRGSGFKFFS